MEAGKPEVLAEEAGAGQEAAPAGGEFAGPEFVPEFVDAGEVDAFEGASQGRGQPEGREGGLPVQQDGLPAGADDDVAGVVEVEVDEAGGVAGADAGFEGLEEGAGDGLEEHVAGDAAGLAEAGDVAGKGAAEGVPEGEAGLEGLLEAEGGDAAHAGRDEAGFAGEVPQDEGFSPDQVAADGVADEPVAVGEIFFDDGGFAGGFDEIDAGVEGAAAVEKGAERGGAGIGRNGSHRRKNRAGERASQAEFVLFFSRRREERACIWVGVHYSPVEFPLGNKRGRGVAQSGRALGSGPRSRWFKSSRPDQFFCAKCQQKAGFLDPLSLCPNSLSLPYFPLFSNSKRGQMLGAGPGRNKPD